MADQSECTLPNIVFVMTDQQRADFTRAAGFPLDTMPFLDSLAAAGARFDRAYTPMPICAPARCSLFTGRFPKAHRVRQNSGIRHVFFEQDLVGLLRERGYSISLAGKNHSYLKPRELDFAATYSHQGATGEVEGRELSPEEAAFDQWLGELARDRGSVSLEPTPFPLECQQPYRIVRDAIECVDTVGSDGRPFFLWLSFPEPHNPYQVPEPYFSLFPEDAVPERAAGPEALDTKEGPLGEKWRWERRMIDGINPGFDAHWRRYRANYCGMLRLIDDQLGRFVDHLRARGLLDNTLILFTADHGDYAGDYGLQRKGVGLPECLTHIPFILYGPALGIQSAVREDFVSLVDVMPTVCELLGADIPYGVQGRSLWPMLTGQPYPVEEFRSVYVEHGFGGQHYGEHERPPLHFPYDGRRFDELNSVTQSGTTKMVRLGEWKLVYDMLGNGEMYHLPSDPAELHNRYHDPSGAEIRTRLLEELLTWTIRTEDDLPGAAYTPKRTPHNWYRQANNPAANEAVVSESAASGGRS